MPSTPLVTEISHERLAQRHREKLGDIPLFRHCGPLALADLMERVRLVTRAAGHVILSQEEPGDSMFILLTGRARVALLGENGREVTLSIFHPGDFFGEVSLLDQRPRSATIFALDDAKLFSLDRQALLAHLAAYPQTAVNLLVELARRLRRANETIFGLVLDDVESRLLRTIVGLARTEGVPSASGVLLRRRPTQQELANMIGSCRETISRTFTQLERRGLIEKRGQALYLTQALLDRAA